MENWIKDTIKKTFLKCQFLGEAMASNNLKISTEAIKVLSHRTVLKEQFIKNNLNEILKIKTLGKDFK